MSWMDSNGSLLFTPRSRQVKRLRKHRNGRTFTMITRSRSTLRTRNFSPCCRVKSTLPSISLYAACSTLQHIGGQPPPLTKRRQRRSTTCKRCLRKRESRHKLYVPVNDRRSLSSSNELTDKEFRSTHYNSYRLGLGAKIFSFKVSSMT